MDSTEKSGSSKDVPRILKWEGPVPVPSVPETNYGNFLLNLMSQFGDKKAVTDAATGKYHTYGDICRCVPRIRQGLAKAGVKRGETVVLMTPNHIDFPLALLAVISGGATCAPVSPTLRPDELAHVLRLSGARWAVVHESLVPTVEEAFGLMEPGTLGQIWVLGSAPNRPSFARLIRKNFGHGSDREVTVDPKRDIAIMQFSSGTTGPPKGVMLTHLNLMTALFQNNYLRSLLPEGMPNVMEAVLLIIPIYHTYGYTVFISALGAGGNIVLMSKFSPEKYFDAIQTYKVTYSPIVPHIASYLTKSDLMKKYDLSSLFAFASGASQLPTTTHMALMEKTGKGAGIGYGMTESCATIAVSGGATGFQPGSVGKLLPYFEGKIIDVVTGALLPEGAEGEICVRGPSVMLGYVKNPKATSETLDAEGWLHTGDLGYYNEDGFIFLTDRMKDLIKVKGFQVNPSELEKIVQEMEGVSEVAIVGVPDARMGEAPRAWVVPVPGATLDPDAIQRHVAGRVSSSYKQLAGGVEVVKELPRNHLGKVLKRQLKKEFLSPRSKL